jgi:multiple sugar transport system substrate-binding protein
MRHLSGTTWAHTRAIAPLAAASQWFVDAGADVSVSWSTHPARQFGEGPISSLIDQFDLICFDHPHVGHAANGGLFIPADEFLSQAELAERERASTSLSFESYRFGGRCQVPDDWLLHNRRALLFGREVLKAVMAAFASGSQAA